MKTIYKAGALSAAVLVGAWLSTTAAWPQNPGTPPPLPVQQQQAATVQVQDQGVQVLNQGPVHEAYAAPITGQPQPGPVVPKQPPDPVDEMPPDEQPEGNNVQWIPGYWLWDDASADFVWVSGFWRDVPPDKEWIPGYWNQVEGGWQWVPGYWANAQLQEVTYLPPPPASIDTGPSVQATNPDDIYAPGVWVYRQNRYFWRPGFYIAYNPNWVYVPAHYIWCPAGYVFIDGYWDFPLERRGLLFAPVVFNGAVLRQPNWTYTPQYVVPATNLVTALFVRPAFASYYFGDYFGTAYQQRGYVPWIDYRIGRAGYDPLFANFSVRYRNDERYLRSLRELYVERQAGRAPRPPRTFTEVSQVSRNAQGVPQTATALSLVAPLREANRQGIKLQQVPRERLVQEHNLARQMTTVRTARQQTEQRTLAQGGPLTKPTERPRTTKWEVPHVTRPVAQAPARVQRPELPRQPQHVQQPLPQHQPLTPERVQREPLQPRPGARPGEQRPPNEPRPGVRPGETPQRPEARPVPNEARPAVPPAKEVRPEQRPAPKQEKQPEKKQPEKKEPPRAAAPEGRPTPNRPAAVAPPRPQPTAQQPRPEPAQQHVPAIHEARPTPPPQHAAPAPRPAEPPREARPQPAPHPAPAARAPEARAPAPQPHPQPAAPPPAARPQPAPHPAPPPRPAEPPHDKEKR